MEPCNKMAEAEGMTKEHRKILREHRLELEENLQPLKLLSHLTSVLSEEDEEDVKAERTTIEQVRRLLDMLPRRGDKAFEAFVRALEKTQRFLAIPIAQGGNIELSNAKDGYNGLCMQPEHKELLRSNKELLKNIKLDMILPLMEVMFDKEDKEEINCETTKTSKLDKFLTILGKKEDKAFDHFVNVLKITDPSIAKFLVKEQQIVNIPDEKGLPNPSQIVNPEDDTEISKVKDKLTSFCQKTNENNDWESLAHHFEVQTDKVRNSPNPTHAVLELLPTRKVGDLKEALNYLQMKANMECLVKDLAKQTDSTDSPGLPAPSPMNALVQKTQNLSIADKLAGTFGDLSEENQKRLIEQIQKEKKNLNYEIDIPPDHERQKYKIRDLTKLLREKKMNDTIMWMKNNLQKGITGPLYDENTNVRDLPYTFRSKLTVQLCANDYWKTLACHLGLANHEIDYFDSHRFKNPADEVLKQWETKRNTTVGDLYDILVSLNMPVIADSAL